MERSYKEYCQEIIILHRTVSFWRYPILCLKMYGSRKSIINTGYVASSHSKQSYIKRVLKMLLSEPLASLITFSKFTETSGIHRNPLLYLKWLIIWTFPTLKTFVYTCNTDDFFKQFELDQRAPINPLTTVHFIKVCQRLFGHNFFITCYF